MAPQKTAASYKNIVATLLVFVDLGVIETPPDPCHGSVLPLNYRPVLISSSAIILSKILLLKHSSELIKFYQPIRSDKIIE